MSITNRELQKIEDTYLRDPYMGGVAAAQQHVIRRLVLELKEANARLEGKIIPSGSNTSDFSYEVSK